MSGNEKIKVVGAAMVFLPSVAFASLQIVDDAGPLVAHVSQPLKIVAKEEIKQPVWIVKPGSHLRAVVSEFAKTAGWKDEWNYKDEQTLEDKDLVLGGGMRIEGDFKTAVHAIFNALPAKAKIRAELVPDNNPPTLFIMREGASQ